MPSDRPSDEDDGVIDESDAACGDTVCSPDEVCCDDAFCSMDITLCGTPAPAPVPSNDLCVNAEGPLPISGRSLDGSIELRSQGTTIGASTHQLPRCGAPVSGSGAWYYTVGNGAIMSASTCWPGTDLDTRLSIFSGTCTGNLVCVGGNDDAEGAGACAVNRLASRVSWQSELGVTYYILVHGFATKVGDFELNIEGYNDQCQYAIELNTGDRIAGDTRGAMLPFDGDTDDCGGPGMVGEAQALWYKVQGTGGRIQTTTCTGDSQLRTFKIHVFESTCSTLDSCIGGDSPSNGCATYEWNNSAGTTYYVLVHNYTPTSAGSFVLEINDMNSGSVVISRAEIFD